MASTHYEWSSGFLRDELAPYYNVKQLFGAVGNGSTDDTAAIQNTINMANSFGGGVVYFPASTSNYKISSELVVYSGITLKGDSTDGAKPTVIKQTNTAANGITGINVIQFGLDHIRIEGPNAVGTGIGVSLTNPLGNPTDYISFKNVRVRKFGGDGIYIQDPIVSRFSNVVSDGNGGHGWNVGGPLGGTSCSFSACYGNANGLAGWYLDHLQYSNFSGCAADANTTGWYLNLCVELSFTGVGTESNVVGTGLFVGNGFVVNGGYGHTFNSPFVYANPAVSFYVTGSANRIVLIAPGDNGPTGTATFSAQFDSGSKVCVISPTWSSPTSYSTQTQVLNEDGNLTTWGTILAKTSNAIAVAVFQNGTALHNNLNISPTGTVQWGPGSALVDTQLQRTGAGQLTMSPINGATDTKIIIPTGTIDVARSIQVGSTTEAFAGGTGVLGMTDASPAPSTTPAGGGVLYSSAGNPRWKNSSGVDTPLIRPNFRLPEDHGWIAYNYDPQATVNKTLTVNGTIYMIGLILREAQTIANLAVMIDTIAVSPVANQNFLALVDASGTIQGSTAAGTVDASTLTTGVMSKAMSASYAAPAGRYWVAALFNAATPPQLARLSGESLTGIDFGLSAANFWYAVNGTAATALPGSFTMSANTHTGAFTAWAGVS